MILLGVNGGFGQTDCASLPLSSVDLGRGWVDFPRPKAGVDRLVPLWPETAEALRQSIAERPNAKDPEDDGLVFLTRQGRRWVRMRKKGNADATHAGWTPVDSVALMFGRLLTRLNFKRPGLNFYALRHTFETVAGETRDQPAVNAVMGHDPADMASVYREIAFSSRATQSTSAVRSIGCSLGR